MDYVFSLTRDDRRNLLGANNQMATSRAAQLNKDNTLKNSRFFLRIVYAVSKEEFLNAPLWALPKGAKIALTREKNLDMYKNFKAEAKAPGTPLARSAGDQDLPSAGSSAGTPAS